MRNIDDLWQADFIDMLFSLGLGFRLGLIFDSYGNLKPPEEFIKYLDCKVHYNYDNIQRNHPYNCGLCLSF